ncbi:MAG: hypothetical protein O2971_19330 [Proteobacteria bacterium]|nr:hypothetical protein [Pseudomonadota bacterium]
MDHYIGLIAAYAVVTCLRLGLLRLKPELIPVPALQPCSYPGRELVYLVLTVVVIIGIGQFYTAGMLLPRTANWEWLTEALNQVFIFSPVLLFLLLIKPAPVSLYLVHEQLGQRFALGLGLALCALIVFWLATPADLNIVQLLGPLSDPDNLDFPVQVFFEDLLIAMFLARCSQLISPRWTIVLVASLFAAAHIPAFLAQGDAPAELLSLLADTALGIMVLGSIILTRDFIWIFPVHVVMDSTQLHF